MDISENTSTLNPKRAINCFKKVPNVSAMKTQMPHICKQCHQEWSASTLWINAEYPQLFEQSAKFPESILVLAQLAEEL
jgi:hypothetical protein